MNRELTKREKVLLLVLIVLVVALGYFKLILEPINDQVTSYRSAMEVEQSALDIDLIRAAQMDKMQQTVEELKASGTLHSIPRYDNSGSLMIELHKIMEKTLDYSLDCSQGTAQESYIMLRPIVMTYRTATYAQARQIIDELCESENISQISNVDIRVRSGGTGGSSVTTTLVITYFEIVS